MKNRLLPVVLSTLALTLALVAPVRAAADDDDPPTRVARLSYTHGAISFQPAGTEDWVEAVVNRPITTGDKIWADRDARAELHLGSASLRISSNTGFSFLNLDDNVTQVQLTAGDLRVRIKRLEANESFEVDTPNLAFSLLRPGIYRISVNEAGDTTVIKVRGGEGEVTGGGAAYAVHPQETGSFTGTDQLEADIQRSHSRDDDDFDDWCAERDRREDRALSARYVSPDVVGYEDLDEYGSWRPVPEYGTIWFPRVTVVGWAPYRYGHWAYIPPWGYTWVDDSPWGFAPFHYGRWVFVRGAWGWVPAPPPVVGVTYVRPVYAPALVAWVGGGPRGGIGVSVGWFPLGPREVYVPSYRVSRTYITNVNVSSTRVSTTVINNYYNTTVINRTTIVEHQRWVNQGVGITATNTRVLTSCQPVGRNVVHMDAREVSRAQVSVVTPAVAPERRAVFGSAPTARVRPPERFETRPVVAKIAPPPAPVPFVRQQQAIQANGGRPLSRDEVRRIQPPSAPASHPQVRMATQPATQPREDRDAGRFRRDRNEQGDRPGMPAATGNQNSPVRGNNQPASNNSAAPAANTNSQPNGRFPMRNNPPAVNGAADGNNPAVTSRPGMGTSPEAHGDRSRGDRPPASGSNPPAVSNAPASNVPSANGNSQPNSRFPVNNTPPTGSGPTRTYNDRPASARPNTADSNSAQDPRLRQDTENVRAQQDRQRPQPMAPRPQQVEQKPPQQFETRPQQVPQRPQQMEPRPQQVEQKPQPVQQRPQQVEQRPQPVDQRAHEQRVEQRRDQPRPEPKKEDRPKKDSDSKDKHDKDKDKNDRPH